MGGMLFTAFGSFNAARAYSLWPHMRATDKVFNIAACGFIYMLAGASFYKGYEIHMGKEMELVELRPSYSQKFREIYRISNMTSEEKQEYLRQQIQIEEEKEEVRRMIEEQQSQKNMAKRA